MTTTVSSVPGDGVRGVLSVAPFRRLWMALGLSSLGDWLSVLALTSLASIITADRGYAVQSFAVGGVLILKILPTLVLGPLAGALADRFDRRRTMVVADFARFALFLSIPLTKDLQWVFIATFLSECIALFWYPAKDATVPNIVPRERLESANQLGLFTTYGMAPLAAGLFAVLSVVTRELGRAVPFFAANKVDLALYINAVTFLVSALTIASLKEIPKQVPPGDRRTNHPSVLRSVVEGWRFVGRTKIVRGILIGMLGAFAAGGAVIGVGRVYVDALGGGDAAYGVLFGAVFLGLALGMFLGPRVLAGFSRRRLFGLTIVGAGLTLCVAVIIQNLIIVVLLTLFVGAFSGIAWVCGYTLVGLEVDDGLRGRTFGFLQSLVKVDLLLVLAVVPFVAGTIGSHTLDLWSGYILRLDGAHAVLLLGGLVAVLVGAISYHQMDDRRGIPLRRDLSAAARGGPYPSLKPRLPGRLIAFEGGEGSGKTTQARALSVWLRDQGFDVVMTKEPGATRLGMRLRAILLDLSHKGMSPRAEALMYAADRAEHVDSVIRPAMERGSIVVTDRYVDSTLAYQGAGRRLPVEEVKQLNRYATGGLLPDLTILLDVPPAVGLSRFASPADRMESEPREFHERARAGFRALAAAESERYLVVDASRPVEEIAQQIQDRVRPILPDPVPDDAEKATGSFPAITPSESAKPSRPGKSDKPSRSRGGPASGRPTRQWASRR